VKTEWTDKNGTEPEHSFEEVVVRGFLILVLRPLVLHQMRVEVPSLGGHGVARGEGKGSEMGELDMEMRHRKTYHLL